MIRSNVREITAVWSPAIGYIQELETLTAKYRIKQYQHLAEICWHLTHPLKQQGQAKQVKDLRLLQIRLENWQQTAHSQQ